MTINKQMALVIFKNSLGIALIVGSMLNIINQHNALFESESIAWGKLALNYLVPFCVATYSAWKTIKK